MRVCLKKQARTVFLAWFFFPFSTMQRSIVRALLYL